MDDGQFVGTLPELEKVMGDLEAVTERTGLRLNKAKCELVCSPCMAPEARDPYPHLAQTALILPGRRGDVQRLRFRGMEAATSLKCLGVPVGTPSEVETQLEAFERLMVRYSEELVALRDPQTALLLLRYCFGSCRMTHCLQVIPRARWGPLLPARHRAPRAGRRRDWHRR